MEIIKQKFLMWTDIEININSNFSEKKILEDIEKSFDIFSDLENEFSRFSQKSDLSILNKNKSLEVSNRFLKVLELSKAIYKITNWFFNPLINVSNIWYSESFEKINNNPSPALPLILKEGSKMSLDLEKIKIIWNKIILEEDQNLDFGGIVKWYCVDLVQEFLEKNWYYDFIINAGWDIFVSKKSCVAIDSPFIKDNIFALITLENKAISTSGTYKRNWKIGEKNYHHILNPKDNKNNNEIISISLVSDKCYISDCFATSCIAMWIEKSIMFLEKQKIDWVIIWSDWKIYKIWDLGKYEFDII